MLVDDVVVVVKVFEFIDEAVVINEHPSLFLKLLDLLVAARGVSRWLDRRRRLEILKFFSPVGGGGWKVQKWKILSKIKNICLFQYLSADLFKNYRKQLLYFVVITGTGRDGQIGPAGIPAWVILHFPDFITVTSNLRLVISGSYHCIYDIRVLCSALYCLIL